MDTLSQGNFFFFLARSSMVVVGSAPADNKNKTGSYLVESFQMFSMAYEIGEVYWFPNVLPIY
jgi:hypothetical protein